jgi:hypothetical protein
MITKGKYKKTVVAKQLKLILRNIYVSGYTLWRSTLQLSHYKIRVGNEGTWSRMWHVTRLDRTICAGYSTAFLLLHSSTTPCQLRTMNYRQTRIRNKWRTWQGYSTISLGTGQQASMTAWWLSRPYEDGRLYGGEWLWTVSWEWNGK